MDTTCAKGGNDLGSMPRRCLMPFARVIAMTDARSDDRDTASIAKASPHAFFSRSVAISPTLSDSRGIVYSISPPHRDDDNFTIQYSNGLDANHYASPERWPILPGFSKLGSFLAWAMASLWLLPYIQPLQI